MKIMFASVDEFDRLCEHLGFTHLPRSIGNPRQEFCFATEQIYQRFSKWEGSKSCFISTQGYDNLEYDAGGRQIPKTIIYGLTFFDFDHDDKAENALADVQRLSQFLTNISVHIGFNTQNLRVIIFKSFTSQPDSASITKMVQARLSVRLFIRFKVISRLRWIEYA